MKNLVEIIGSAFLAGSIIAGGIAGGCDKKPEQYKQKSEITYSPNKNVEARAEEKGEEEKRRELTEEKPKKQEDVAKYQKLRKYSLRALEELAQRKPMEYSITKREPFNDGSIFIRAERKDEKVDIVQNLKGNQVQIVLPDNSGEDSAVNERAEVRKRQYGNCTTISIAEGYLFIILTKTGGKIEERYFKVTPKGAEEIGRGDGRNFEEYSNLISKVQSSFSR